MSVFYNVDDGEWFEPLPDNVVIGERSYLYSSYAFRHCLSQRDPAVRIGHDTGVYANTVFELGPQAEVTIGDYCSIADPTIATNGRVTIGSYCLVGWDSVIADVSWPVPPRSREAVGGAVNPCPESEIVLADNVWVGARAILLTGARIGENAVVGAGSVVDFEVPPGMLAAGNPARVIGPIAGRAR